MKRSALIALVFLLLPLAAVSQHLAKSDKYAQYDPDRLPSSFHKSRRDSLVAHMANHSAALFLSAPEKNRSNDVNYEYHQNPNFYYLTGHIQPESALLLVKTDRVRQILFVQKKDTAKETWTGVRLGTAGAKEILGFEEAYPYDSLPAFLHSLLPTIETIYYPPLYTATLKDPVADSTYSIDSMVAKKIASEYPKLAISNLSREITALRMRKTPEEIELMRKVTRISTDGHNEIIRSVKPGWYEYQLQALGEYIFKKEGAEYTGYPCIVGSGNNSTILHYETNRRRTEDGDLIEMDIAAEYHGYSGDVTRSFPVNGKFTPEQRAIYEIVLEAQDSGIEAARVGNSFRSPHEAALSVIRKGLMKLGIITDPSQSMKYFMHGTSHYLGLDVHDAGNYTSLAAGNIITVEPGIYIAENSPCDKKWWKIGCRIEDDILITPNGPENLSSGAPRTISAIEALMSHH